MIGEIGIDREHTVISNKGEYAVRVLLRYVSWPLTLWVLTSIAYRPEAAHGRVLCAVACKFAFCRSIKFPFVNCTRLHVWCLRTARPVGAGPNWQVSTLKRCLIGSARTLSTGKLITLVPSLITTSQKETALHPALDLPTCMVWYYSRRNVVVYWWTILILQWMIL